ncbi:MAG: phage holin [Clostridia bacterium]|nr:phage holin [Clostridia bacterium]
MKINWKARLKNKAFLLSFITIIVSFVYEILVMIDFVPNISENEILSLVNVVVNVFTMLGIVVDPTTKGLGDSKTALTYYKNKGGDF